MQKESQSTQQFVDIEEIKNGVVILKNGGLRRVLMVAGLNFELKSEEEQNAIIGAYQSFLNSLDFSTQTIIHSRRLNIENYFKKFIERQEKETSQLVIEQIGEYIEFIRSFIKANDIMVKTFFVAVPYDSASLAEGSSKLVEGVPFFGGKSSKSNQNQSLEEKIIQLDQRTDQVVSGLIGAGLRAVVLNDEELVELFYNLYNPQPFEKKDLRIAEK